jgi:hypothetical protein
MVRLGRSAAYDRAGVPLSRVVGSVPCRSYRSPRLHRSGPASGRADRFGAVPGSLGLLRLPGAGDAG